MPQDVLAVVVSYNGGTKTTRTIKALLGQVKHVHVVDNGSDADSRSELSRFVGDSRITIEWLPQNAGIGAALNRGVLAGRARKADWLLTMDQDSTIGAGMIAAFERAVSANPNATCLCPCIIDAPGEGPGEQREVPYAITSGNLVLMRLYEEVGLYDETLFIDGVDFDFSLRVRLAGYAILRVGWARMLHELGEARAQPPLLGRFHTAHSPERRYYIYRNGLHLARRHFRTFPAFIAKLLAVQIVAFVTILMFGPRRAASLRAIAIGVRDAIGGRYGQRSQSGAA